MNVAGAQNDLLGLWERGFNRTAMERPLALLAASIPKGSAGTLSALPIGERDRRLLALREALFGPQFSALADCPQCGEPLECSFAADDLRQDRATATAPMKLHDGEYVLALRPLDSADLIAAERCSDVVAARRTLALRCVTEARRGDSAIEPSELPDALLPAIATQLETADPDAAMTIEVNCPSCALRWESPFDIAAFLWKEIEAEALRLLHDVHRLAAGYGWSESAILELSPVRRRAYLELLRA